MNYKHLTIEEREQIQLMLWQKSSIRKIAIALNRGVSTISREIARNKPPVNKVYTPRLANARAIKKRSSRGREKKLKNDKLREYVVTKLKIGWSPEQIAATAEGAIGTSISHEAIYQYIYNQIHRDGFGYLKSGCEDLRPYLARRKKRRAQMGMRQVQRVKHDSLPSIDDRPLEVALRLEIGHWEDDCIVSGAGPNRLKTTNERKSGIFFLTPIKNGSIQETNRAINERLGQIPQEFRKTLTRDRGSENMGYQELESKLGVKCYFAHPYSSWERGSNENGNGLIRRFLPKKTDFSTITDEEIRRIEYLLNSRPRKRLGWKTPYQVFYELTGVALEY